MCRAARRCSPATLVAVIVLVLSLVPAQHVDRDSQSIPLSILPSLFLPEAAARTINTNYSGGSRSAVGMLVDDAAGSRLKISIASANEESRCWSRILDARPESPPQPSLDRLSICIAYFFPLSCYGVARFLLPPLALAVVFAIRTLLPPSRTRCRLLPPLSSRESDMRAMGLISDPLLALVRAASNAAAILLSALGVFHFTSTLSLAIHARLSDASTVPLLRVTARISFPRLCLGAESAVRSPSEPIARTLLWL